MLVLLRHGNRNAAMRRRRPAVGVSPADLTAFEAADVAVGEAGDSKLCTLRLAVLLANEIASLAYKMALIRVVDAGRPSGRCCHATQLLRRMQMSAAAAAAAGEQV